MWSLAKQFSAPVLSSLFMMLGAGFFLSFITIRLSIAEVSDIWIGFVHGAYYTGLLLGALRIENLIRRIGHIRALAVFASVSTITVLLQAFYIEPLYWMILRLIAGICVAGLFIVIESWLIAKSQKKNRGLLLSLYMITIYGAQGFGQFFLNVVEYDSAQPYIISALFFALSVLPVALTRSNSPPLEEPNLLSWRKLFSVSPFGFTGCFTAGLILGSIYSFMPIFALYRDFSVPWIISCTIIGGLMLQWPIGQLSDHFDRRKVLLLVSFVTLIPAALLLFVMFDFTATLLTVFILGGLSFTLYPLGIAQVCDHYETRDITKITCVLLFTYGLGSSIGPPLSSFWIQYESPLALFAFILVVLGFLISVGLLSIITRPPVPSDEQGSYHPLPRISPIAYLLNPRKRGK